MRKPSLLDRLRAKKAEKAAMVMGVVWYSEIEWARVKASAIDPELFENSYPEWLAMVENEMVTVRKALPGAVKVYVTANELLAWCSAHGKENSSDARAEFVSEKIQMAFDGRV